MAFQKFLLLVVIGVLFMTLIIVIAFIIINKCFIKKVTKYNPASKLEESAKSNHEMKSTFQTTDQDKCPPPLPSRKQFDTESVNSYEDIESLHEESIKPKEFTVLQTTNTISRLGNQINVQDNKSLSESYDDVEDIDQKMGHCSKGFSSVHNKPVEPVNSTLLQNSTIKRQHENQMDYRDDNCLSENYDEMIELDHQLRPSYEGFSSVHNKLMEPAGAPIPQQPIFNYQFDNQIDFQDNKSLSENYDDVEDLDNDLGPSYKGFGSVHDELMEPAGAQFRQQPNINHQFENQKDFQDNKSLSENYDDVEELDNNLDNSYEDITDPYEQTVPEESEHYQQATINLQFINQVNTEDRKSLSDSYEEVDEIGFTVQHSYEDNAAQQEYLDFNEDKADSFDNYDGMEDNVSEDYIDTADTIRTDVLCYHRMIPNFIPFSSS